METRNLLRRAIIGLLLIAAGSILFGFNMGLLPPDLKSYFFTPKFILVILGIVFITKRNHVFLGTAFFIAAALLYLPMIAGFSIDFSKLFWPIILILGGVFVITNRRSKSCYKNHSFKHQWKTETENCYSNKKYWDNRDFEKTESQENYIEDVLFFSGNEKKINSKEFQGGNIVSFFGGLKIDLTNAELAPGNNHLEVVIGFGGCKLVVPSNWNIRVDAVSIFGGFVDKRVIISNSDTSKTLIIKGVAIFGGGEITSM